LEEIGNILQRVRELLVQGANDINTQAQRDMIQQEIQQLGEEIFGMQKRVEFNTNQVLNMGVAADISTAQSAFSDARASFGIRMGSVGVKKCFCCG
jgi:flagellin